MDLELTNYIRNYRSIKWENLLKKELSEFSLVAAEPSLRKMKSIFDKIIDYQEIYSIHNQWSDILKNQIKEFLMFIQIISEYSDTKERNNFINRIKDKEYQVIVALKDLLFIVDYNSNGEDKILERLNLKIHDTIVLEVEEKIKKEFDHEKMIELRKISDDLIKNKNKISEATSLIESMNKEKDIALNKTVEGRALSFVDKANEHKSFQWIDMKFFSFPLPKSAFLWLILSFFFGGLSLFLILLFIMVLKNDNNISVGSAILRISSLVVPSYFAFFCIQQYVNNKKLYEGYKYRDISLKTMKELIMERSGMGKNEQEQQREILSRGLDVIFSEPTVNDDNVQKEVLRILKDVAVKKL